MSVQPNWDILQPVNVLARYQEGFDRGTATRNQAVTENALARFARNPGDRAALDELMPINPALAMRLRTDHEERDTQSRFASAAGRYAAGQRGGQRPMTNPGAIFQAALPEQPGQTRLVMPQEQVPQAAGSDADAAFMEMVQIDPVRAFQIDSAARDAAAERLGMVRDAMGTAGQIIGAATDEPSYQRAVANAVSLLSPFGVDVQSLVPPAYPGPEGIRELQMRAMTAQQQLAAFDRRDRLEADIADDEADNSRADRVADNRIATSNARVALASDREARMAAGRGGRGRRGRRSGRGNSNAPTATGPNGQRLVLRGGRWVPLN